MSKTAATGRARTDWGSDDSHTPILHVDMDAFFASVELALQPDLRGKPVVVGGQGRSVVLAATYEARVFGVHSAMPMATALRKCPHAIVIPPQHHRYYEASKQVMAILADYTTRVEQVSVDEAFLDVSGAGLIGTPVQVAADIKARIRRELDLPCSIGVAASKFVAKVASTASKPNGLLLIPADATVDFLHTLPIRALWGVGEQTAALLARYGITSVAQLANTPREVVMQAVGHATGAHLYNLAWGRDPRPVTSHRPERSISAERTMRLDSSDLAELTSVLAPLAHEVAARLRRAGKQARGVAIKVKLADFTVVTRSRMLPAATDVGATIFDAARALLAGTRLPKPARLVGVRVDHLQDTGEVGTQLSFDEVAGERDARAVEAASDEVRAKFGARFLRPASAVRAPGEARPQRDDAAPSGS